MLGARKLLKLEDRRRRRSQRFNLKARGKGTDKPSTRKFGVYFSAAPAELKAGSKFRHAIEPSPVADGNLIPLRRKYRPIRGGA